MIAEGAKRRLVHQLDEIALPIEMRSATAPDGLAFDLVYLPGTGGITGHLDGVVTLDLAETEDHHREDLRQRLNEPFRTVIGHLRHEIAHHYWVRLVGQTNEVRRFRRLFGDERADYAEAVERYYGANRRLGPQPVRDPVCRMPSARGLGRDLCPLPPHPRCRRHRRRHDLDTDRKAPRSDRQHRRRARTRRHPRRVAADQQRRECHRRIPRLCHRCTRSRPVGAVVDKLAYVHQQIIAHTERDRFNATQPVGRPSCRRVHLGGLRARSIRKYGTIRCRRPRDGRAPSPRPHEARRPPRSKAGRQHRIHPPRQRAPGVGDREGLVTLAYVGGGGAERPSLGDRTVEEVVPDRQRLTLTRLVGPSVGSVSPSQGGPPRTARSRRARGRAAPRAGWTPDRRRPSGS